VEKGAQVRAARRGGRTARRDAEEGAEEVTTRKLILGLTGIAAVLSFAVTSTTTLIPHEHADRVKDIAAVFGFVAALLSRPPA
jgi:hypothetical protein